ncbi:MAG: dihydrofolate reductase [Bacilli bacterium]|nr:dihydrofolate reductase [Bacilli bacterium]
MIKSILCVDNKYGIGKKNGLLFSLPTDMKFFRDTTRGHTVFMGENTLLSFPGSKPLVKRVNVVLSQDVTHNYEGVENVHDFNEFLLKMKEYSKDDVVYVIGGASIYKQTLPYVDEVLLTKANADGGAEVFFPNLDEMEEFECVDEGTPIMDGDIEIRFTRYINKAKKEI